MKITFLALAIFLSVSQSFAETKLIEASHRSDLGFSDSCFPQDFELAEIKAFQKALRLGYTTEQCDVVSQVTKRAFMIAAKCVVRLKCEE